MSLVDLIFVDNLDCITRHGTLPKIADHYGIFITFHCVKQKQYTPKKHTIYNYNDVQEKELINYIKSLDFDTLIFSKPVEDQANIMTNILTVAFQNVVPSKEVKVRPLAPAWTNTYTQLLQRRKNRNYTVYKQARTRYMTAASNPDTTPDILITLQNRQNKAHFKSTESRNNSTNANKRAKTSFYNSVNSTMNNSFISAKKKFGILKKTNAKSKDFYHSTFD